MKGDGTITNNTGSAVVAVLIFVALLGGLFATNPPEEVHKEAFYKECTLQTSILVVNALKLKESVNGIFRYKDFFLVSFLTITANVVGKETATQIFEPVSIGFLGKAIVLKDEEWFKGLKVF